MPSDTDRRRMTACVRQSKMQQAEILSQLCTQCLADRNGLQPAFATHALSSTGEASAGAAGMHAGMSAAYFADCEEQVHMLVQGSLCGGCFCVDTRAVA